VEHDSSGEYVTHVMDEVLYRIEQGTEDDDTFDREFVVHSDGSI